MIPPSRKCDQCTFYDSRSDAIGRNAILLSLRNWRTSDESPSLNSCHVSTWHQWLPARGRAHASVPKDLRG